MSVRVEKLPLAIWKDIAVAAHETVFNEPRQKDMDRIDFALLAVESVGDILLGYVTCRELDKHNLYWANAGTFPSIRGQGKSFKVYKHVLDWCRERYDTVFAQVLNTNSVALNFALRSGFVVHGCRHWEGNVFVELALDFRGGSKVDRPPGYPDMPDTYSGC